MNELVLVVGCVQVDERGGTVSFSTVTTLLSRDDLVLDWPAATAKDVNLSYGVTFFGFFTSLLLLWCRALLPPGLMLCLPFNDMMNPSSFRVASSLRSSSPGGVLSLVRVVWCCWKVTILIRYFAPLVCCNLPTTDRRVRTKCIRESVESLFESFIKSIITVSFKLLNPGVVNLTKT